MKQFIGHNKPYIKVADLLGIDGLKKIIYKATLQFSGRKNLVLKNNLQAAKDWSITQD